MLIDSEITITVTVSGFNLVDAIGKPNVAGEGHINYFLNVAAPTAPGQPATAAAGSYNSTAATSYTWPNLPDGAYTFYVELVNNDNTPLSPPQVDQVAISIFTG